MLGDLMVDVTVRAPALARGGDVHGEVLVQPAGAGPNVAAWAASLGARVRLHGRVGDDVPGRMLREELGTRGVDLRVVVDDEARTGAMLVVLQEGDRSMVADRGANARLEAGDLPERLEASAIIVSGYLLFEPGSEPAATAAIAGANALHVAVDAASWPLLGGFGSARFFRATVGATLLLANEREAEVLTGAGDAERACLDLADRYGAAAVKLGRRGAILAADGRLLRGAAPAVEPIDPTGAGDAFDGALLATLAGGADHAEALETACRAGARAAASAKRWPDPR